MFIQIVSLFIICLSAICGTESVSASEISFLSENSSSTLSYSELNDQQLYEVVGNLSSIKRNDLSISVMSKDSITLRDEKILSTIAQVEKDMSTQTRNVYIAACVGISIIVIWNMLYNRKNKKEGE